MNGWLGVFSLFAALMSTVVSFTLTDNLDSPIGVALFAVNVAAATLNFVNVGRGLLR